MIRKIYGPIADNDEYGRLMNNELYKLYSDIDIVMRIKLTRFHWLSHVSMLDKYEPARKFFEDILEGIGKIGQLGRISSTMRKHGINMLG